jgi:peptide/nickel transport system permease protein
VDDFMSRATEVFQMIPVFFLLIVTAALFGSDISFVILAIGLTTWPSNARIMRSQVLTLKRRPYVLALVSTGASMPRILFRHIIPNGVFPVITNSALRMGSAMLTEAGLSFLGLGDPNVISWGQMVQGSQLMLNMAPWISLFPGMALLLLVCAFNLVGDGLNFAMNPRLRAR